MARSLMPEQSPEERRAPVQGPTKPGLCPPASCCRRTVTSALLMTAPATSSWSKAREQNRIAGGGQAPRQHPHRGPPRDGCEPRAQTGPSCPCPGQAGAAGAGVHSQRRELKSGQLPRPCPAPAQLGLARASSEWGCPLQAALQVTLAGPKTKVTHPGFQRDWHSWAEAALRLAPGLKAPFRAGRASGLVPSQEGPGAVGRGPGLGSSVATVHSAGLGRAEREQQSAVGWRGRGRPSPGCGALGSCGGSDFRERTVTGLGLPSAGPAPSGPGLLPPGRRSRLAPGDLLEI